MLNSFINKTGQANVGSIGLPLIINDTFRGSIAMTTPTLSSRTVKKQPSKICESCDQVFHKGTHEGLNRWAARRYCSQPCRYIGISIFLLSVTEQLKRIWSKTIETHKGCLEYRYNIDFFGYGHITRHGKKYKAHRHVYELINGPIPDGLCVLHRCDNPCCVAPNHLFIGTFQDNTKDMFSKGRSAIGEKHRNSRLTEAQALSIKLDVRKQCEIAKDYGVSFSLVCRIKAGKTWKHLSQSEKEVV